MHANPQTTSVPGYTRAAELRKIRPPGEAEGWAVRIWLALTKFIGITGGIAAVVVPKRPRD
ncbi:hypothetical protein AZE42_06808 [Rhizopogon vesiculosus]|uniref:Uncharacterized protein n=1 Tax=Rhizopogon vesiculosus TaxID=180088 RepID=A0A1J8RAZ6_9AGAM|nr:hypothetical protein AZE42_06808 [Rhizopogon vesiculosus]